MVLLLRQWGTVLTERDLGAEIRENILKEIRRGEHVTIDFSGVTMINSSFADEVFGKLIVDIGAEKARQMLSISNVNTTLKIIINEAISTRLALPV